MPDWMHVRYDPVHRAAHLTDPYRAQLRVRLQAFQSVRLRQDHDDLARSPQYGRLAQFFFEDIYGPHDFDDRNTRFRQLYDKLVHIVGPKPLAAMKESLDLVELTDALDDYLIDVLVLGGKADAWTTEDYEWAYRECDNYLARVEQIERIGATLRSVANLSRLPLIDWHLKALRLPARRLGWEPTLGFLIRGYQVFHHARNVEPFVRAVETRETARLNRIYGVTV